MSTAGQGERPGRIDPPVLTPPQLHATYAAIGQAARQYGANQDAWRFDPDFQNVKVRADPATGVLVFCYNQRATLHWTPIERVSRGLAVDPRSGLVVARAWPKFWDWAQLGDATRVRLQATPITVVSEKLDGSLGIVWWSGRELRWRVHTKGSFTGPIVDWAQRMLDDGPYDLDALNPEYTYLCEIIAPQNRIVIDYGNLAHLTLLGALRNTPPFDREADLPMASAWRIGRWAGIPVVAHTDPVAIGTILEAAANNRQMEGWVVRFADGTRVKFKTPWYLALHSTYSGFSVERAREALLAGNVADYRAKLPDSLLARFDEYVRAIDGLRWSRVAAYMEIYTAVKTFDTGGKDGRRAFAQAVQREVHQDVRWAMFMLLDGKDIARRVLERLDLSGISGHNWLDWREEGEG